jgi:hypothetical protein
MIAMPRAVRLVFIASRVGHTPFAFFSLVLILVACALSLHASAQTTTISGTIYDPRNTPSALPLPNVLVYVTTGTVAPLPGGVQCLTHSAPGGVTSYTYTGVDGTFTLKNVPVNISYTLVIQAGKWRRQFPEAVDTAPLSGLNLHMPSNHLEGDVPMVAIATGGADGVECVIRAMGVADSEFTDDTGTTNPGGHIHLYQGSGSGYQGSLSGGAYISPSTPLDTALTGDAAKINSYDMVMFPCQGGPYYQTDAALSNVVNFANAGGRVFSTHFSYVWLDPDSPWNSQFPPVANWDPTFTYPSPDPGVATVNTGFTDGATLAQWLQNAGAAYNGEPGQVQISTLRHDVDSIIPPTQAWLTLNDSALDNPVMQLTFNTPVGAAAADQCGRVLFNEYHVINLDLNLTGKGVPYPTECPSGPMSAQEEMLEYALFDLSAFVQPVVVPTLSIAFNPSPLVVNDTSDQVTIDVTNTSADTSIDPSATLSMTLPQSLTATAVVDATNGWHCTLSTLKCTRRTSIPSTQSDSILLTVSVGAPTGSTSAIKAVVSSPTFSNDVTAIDTVIFPPTPMVSVTPSPNPAFLSNTVTITASIPSSAGTPGGTVTFFDGETQLGSSSVSAGSATLSTSALTMGTHNITAAYSGDANYRSAISSASLETIEDFAIAVAPGSSTGIPNIFPGASVSYSFVVSPIGGATMPAALALSVDGAPVNAAAVFSPSVVAANSGMTTVTMVVNTPPLAAAEPPRSPLGKGTLPMALGLVLLPFARRLRNARRWIQVLVLSIAGVAFVLGVTGCSGITYTTRSFSMTVTAKSGNLSHTASVKLNVR